jgi:hypothetical protein
MSPVASPHHSPAAVPLPGADASVRAGVSAERRGDDRRTARRPLLEAPAAGRGLEFGIGRGRLALEDEERRFVHQAGVLVVEPVVPHRAARTRHS